jgi:hypothetical protein
METENQQIVKSMEIDMCMGENDTLIIKKNTASPVESDKFVGFEYYCLREEEEDNCFTTLGIVTCIIILFIVLTTCFCNNTFTEFSQLNITELKVRNLSFAVPLQCSQTNNSCFPILVE